MNKQQLLHRLSSRMDMSLKTPRCFWETICLLLCLLVAMGCSDEVPGDVTQKEWASVYICKTAISDITVCELGTKSSGRELPPEVKTGFNADDQLKLTYTLNATEQTATATKTDGGWEIIDDVTHSPLKLPVDFTGEVTATTLVQTPSETAYQTNKLKATCTPEYDTASKTFSLSLTFLQESAGIQADVIILSGDPTSVQLAYKENSGSTPQYVEIGTSTAFTETLFFDTDGNSQITGIQVVVNGSGLNKAFDTPLTLTKGTFYFIDLLIADVNDLNPTN